MTTDPLDRTLELLDERDLHDPSSDEYAKLDVQAFNLVWPVALERNLRGAEFWYGNGPYRQGIVTDMRVIDGTLYLIVDGEALRGDGLVYDLACGRLQCPGLPVDADTCGLSRTIDVLRAAPPLPPYAEAA
jgi:hypothetical protein